MGNAITGEHACTLFLLISGLLSMDAVIRSDEARLEVSRLLNIAESHYRCRLLCRAWVAWFGFCYGMNELE